MKGKGKKLLGRGVGLAEPHSTRSYPPGKPDTVVFKPYSSKVAGTDMRNPIAVPGASPKETSDSLLEPAGYILVSLFFQAPGNIGLLV